MRNPNELRKFFSFEINECEAVKEYLEEMALKGWKLKSFNTFFCFEKIEPQRLYYSVEVFSKASSYDTIPAVSTNEYIEYCRKAGWDFICNIGQINVFVSESEKSIPIETDETLRFKTIVKGILKQNIITWFFMPIVFLLNIILNYLDFESFTTSNLGLIVFSSYIMCLMFTVIHFSHFIVWIAKQKRRLKNDEPIKYITLKEQKRNTKIRLFPFTFIIFIFLIITVQSFLYRDYITAGTMFYNILLIPAILFLCHLIRKGGFSRTANKLIPIVLTIGVCFITMIFSVVIIYINSLKAQPYIHLIASTGTFLASREKYEIDLGHSTASENFEKGLSGYRPYWDDIEYCYFTVFKSKYGFIIDQYLYSEKHKPINKNYKEVSLPEWGAKEAFTVNGTKKTYVVYEDYVVSFNSECPFTKEIIEQMLQERENK